jgi:prepilin-type N-terminal cleavage/methylation domain-containing protein
LIELLVVIAIIGILASMLFLNAERGSRRGGSVATTTCASWASFRHVFQRRQSAFRTQRMVGDDCDEEYLGPFL